ncbi:MAG: hypothetical protein WCK32_00865 [Chlorobiaceae bacterium]
MKRKWVLFAVLAVFFLIGALYPVWKFTDTETALFDKRQQIKVIILSDSLQCERYNSELMQSVNASSQYKETADVIALHRADSELERLKIELRMLKKQKAFMEKSSSLIEPLIKIYQHDRDSMRVVFKKTQNNSPFFLSLRKFFPFNGERADAFDNVKAYALSKLKTPSTATFASYSDENTTVGKNGNIYSVISYVDAQNGYGAMIREKYFGVVQRSKEGKWLLRGFLFL